MRIKPNLDLVELINIPYSHEGKLVAKKFADHTAIITPGTQDCEYLKN
jgi:hypothetical protein